MAIAASLLSGAGAALAQSDGAVPTAPPASTTPAIPAPLTLSSAIAEALAANPIARSAGYQAAQAEARLGQAEAQRRLQFSFSSTAGGSNVDVYQPPPAHETFGSLQNSVTLPIPIGSRPRLVVTQSREQVRAAQAQLQGARVALAAQVVTAYYDLLKKQALAAIAQDTLAQAQRQQAEAQKRFRAGDVPELDAIRAQVPVASAQASLAQMETDVAIARQTLNGLLGRPLAAPVSVEDVPATLAGIDLTPESALSQALANNAEVCAADATIRANTAALAAARRYRDPSLSLQAIHNRSGDKTGFSREDSLQATISLPLSDGGLGAAQVREATAALAQSQADAAAARRTVEINVATAYLTAQSSRQQVQAAATTRDVAQISYDNTARGYTAGLFPLTDVLSAQSALNQARIAYTQALYDAAAAASALTNTVNGAAPAAPATSPVPAPSAPSATPPGPPTGNGSTNPSGASTP